MQENEYQKNVKINELPPGTEWQRIGEGENELKPDFFKRKRRQISLYFALTVSAAIFIISFSLADFGITMIKEGGNSMPSYLLASVLDDDGVPVGVSELMIRSVLGVRIGTSCEVALAKNSGDLTDKPKDTKQLETNDAYVNENADTEPDKTEAVTEKETEEVGKITEYPIQTLNLSEKSLGKYYIANETGYTPDIKALLNTDYSISAFAAVADSEKSDKPVVLIIHTHGTEAYMEEGVEKYTDDGGEFARSNDIKNNVVAVGGILADTLIKAGIPTIHCEIMHDQESYQESYLRAASTIKKYLDKYPTIKYVFDVHRDSILKSDGTLVRAAVDVDGKTTAQVMSVVGTNYKGADFPDWENHLSLALKLREKLNNKYEDLCRPVYLRGAAFNEQYAEGSLLLEIGSSGNTLSEAKRAAEYVGEALAEMIKGK